MAARVRGAAGTQWVGARDATGHHPGCWMAPPEDIGSAEGKTVSSGEVTGGGSSLPSLNFAISFRVLIFFFILVSLLDVTGDPRLSDLFKEEMTGSSWDLLTLCRAPEFRMKTHLAECALFAPETVTRPQARAVARTACVAPGRAGRWDYPKCPLSLVHWVPFPPLAKQDKTCPHSTGGPNKLGCFKFRKYQGRRKSKHFQNIPEAQTHPRCPSPPTEPGQLHTNTCFWQSVENGSPSRCCLASALPCADLC